MGREVNESNLKGMSLMQRLRKRLSLQSRSLDGSTERGMIKVGGVTSPTFPQIEIVHVVKQFIIDSEMNWAKGLREVEFKKVFGGDNMEF